MEWKLERSSASRASPSPPQPQMVRQGSQAGAMYCMNGVLLVAFVMNAIVTYTYASCLLPLRTRAPPPAVSRGLSAPSLCRALQTDAPHPNRHASDVPSPVRRYGVHGSFGETAASQLEAFPTLVTPAAWSFSIWAVIFVGEGAFAAVQLCTRRFNFADKEEVRTIAPWFLSVCVCQALWTVAIAQPLSAEGQSTWYVWLSLGLMFALWVSLYGPPAPPRTAQQTLCRGVPSPASPSPSPPLPRPAPCFLSRAPGSRAWQRSCGYRQASTPTLRDRAGAAGHSSTSPSRLGLGLGLG